MRPIVKVYNKYLTSPKAEPSAFSLYPQYVTNRDVVIEIGARTGAGTLVLAKLAKEVYAFEPNFHSYELLVRFAKHRDNIKSFNIALGDKNGEAWLNIGDDTSMATPSDSFKKLAGIKYAGSMKVKMSRLDDLDFPSSPTCFIIDCEGSEEEALTGGRNLLSSNNSRTVLVETHILNDGSSTFESVKADLENFGFSLSIQKDSDGLDWLIGKK